MLQYTSLDDMRVIVRLMVQCELRQASVLPWPVIGVRLLADTAVVEQSVADTVNTIGHYRTPSDNIGHHRTPSDTTTGDMGREGVKVDGRDRGVWVEEAWAPRLIGVTPQPPSVLVSFPVRGSDTAR